MLEERIAAALSAAMSGAKPETQLAPDVALPDVPLPDVPLVVAFSGGLDSTVLLHALIKIHGKRAVRAVHVNHGLSAAAPNWEDHCRAQCAQLGVALTVLKVSVDPNGDGGLEAQARSARYAALAGELRPGERVVTAHHQQDQLETVLLALLRGSGVHGLAAMPAFLQRPGMTLLRPLLGIGRDELLAAAQASSLSWIDDPSNDDVSFDRNYLRHEVVPLLQARWPAAARSATRSARLTADAMRIIDEVAAGDVAGSLFENRLHLGCMRTLSRGRQRNAMRWVCRALGLPIPAEAQLREALDALLSEREDAEPLAAWPGTRIRRYRSWLWFYSASADPGQSPEREPALADHAWDPQTSLDLGPVSGRLSLEPAKGQGVAAQSLQGGLRVRFRAGGEQLRPGPQARRRDLKKLLQERSVLPWMRKHIPLIYVDDELLAVGDLWINADHPAVVEDGGRVIRWSNHSQFQTPDCGPE